MSRYYFLAGDEVRGPFSLADCFLLLDQGTLHGSTQICPEDAEDWKPLDRYPELAGHKSPTPHPAHTGPGALTICAGILLAVFILGVGGELFVQYQDQQEADRAQHEREAIAEMKKEEADRQAASEAAQAKARAEYQAAHRKSMEIYAAASQVISGPTEPAEAWRFAVYGSPEMGTTEVIPGTWDVWGTVVAPDRATGEEETQIWELIFPEQGEPLYRRLGDYQQGDKKEVLAKLTPPQAKGLATN